MVSFSALRMSKIFDRQVEDCSDRLEIFKACPLLKSALPGSKKRTNTRYSDILADCGNTHQGGAFRNNWTKTIASTISLFKFYFFAQTTTEEGIVYQSSLSYSSEHGGHSGCSVHQVR